MSPESFPFVYSTHEELDFTVLYETLMPDVVSSSFHIHRRHLLEDESTFRL